MRSPAGSPDIASQEHPARPGLAEAGINDNLLEPPDFGPLGILLGQFERLYDDAI
jgi:hypothetical protein